MFRKSLAVGICLMLLFVAACSEPETEVAQDKPEAPASTVPEPEPEPESAAPESPEANPEDLYEQIKTGMALDKVLEIMAGREPFVDTKGAIDTPSGRIETHNISWRFGDSAITVIFQDNKVLGKDLSQI